MKQGLLFEGNFNFHHASPRKYIHLKCRDCKGTSAEVKECTQKKCSLFPFRTGKGRQNRDRRDWAIWSYCEFYCMYGKAIEEKRSKRCPSICCPLYDYRPEDF